MQLQYQTVSDPLFQGVRVEQRALKEVLRQQIEELQLLDGNQLPI